MKLRILLALATLFLLTFPTGANAEIATVKDWVGLFPVNAVGIKSNTVAIVTPTPANFIEAKAWFYASTCTQTPPPAGTQPRLENPGDPTVCKVTIPYPLTGFYVWRMYAYDKDENTPDSLIAVSNQISFYNISPSPTPARPAGKLYRVTGDLTINPGGDLTVNETGVIFVEGNLYINTDILNNNATKGLVFVVKGEIFINRSVSKVNAFLIAHGKSPTGANMIPVCTAYDPVDGCNDYADNATRKYLEVNGAIIALNTNPDFGPKFARAKYDSTVYPSPTPEPIAAETINYEPKYLVIMKDIFSRDLKIWREVQ